jgi:hypothetical protein
MPAAFVFLCGPLSAGVITTQDLFVVGDIQMNTSGGLVDLTAAAIARAQSQPGPSVTFVGGAVFVSSNALHGEAGNENLVYLGNTSVIPGVLTYGSDSFFSILVSSDVSTEPESVGFGGVVQIDFSDLYPAGVNVGDVGVMDYTFLQFLKPGDPATEAGLTDLQIAGQRASLGLIQMPSMSGTTLTEVYDSPFVVAQGSKGWRYFGKVLVVVGTTAGGAIGGATAGSVAPAIGTVIGGVGGGVAGFLTSLGGVIIENNKDDATPDRSPGTQPASGALTTPEPGTLGLCLAALAVAFRDRRRK